MNTLADTMTALADRVAANNRWRQRECINLIPSETTPSLLVKACEVADAAGRYAEHRRLKGAEVYFYQGTDFIREVEEQVHAQAQRFFGCDRVEARPVTGQLANIVVFEALLRLKNRGNDGPMRRLSSVINNGLIEGGHLSAQSMGALYNAVDRDAAGVERTYPIPVRADNPYLADTEALLSLVGERRPDLIVFGKSMFLHPEPVRAVADFTAGLDDPPLLMFDMAHVLGLYGAFQAPLAEGAAVVTGSTHKTFFGPQRGVVLGSPAARPLWPHVRHRACPGTTSNHHLGTLIGFLAALYEMNACKDDYQRDVIGNARAFAQALAAAGVSVEGGESEGYTHSHQVIVRVAPALAGDQAAERLERNNIITNYQALPGDASFAVSGGVRMGVQEMTRYGMQAADFESVAELIARVVLRDQDVRDEVAALRARFRDMRYCLPADQAIPLAMRMLEPMFPVAADAVGSLIGAA